MFFFLSRARIKYAGFWISWESLLECSSADMVFYTSLFIASVLSYCIGERCCWQSVHWWFIGAGRGIREGSTSPSCIRKIDSPNSAFHYPFSYHSHHLFRLPWLGICSMSISLWRTCTGCWWRPRCVPCCCQWVLLCLRRGASQRDFWVRMCVIFWVIPIRFGIWSLE